jgi:AcrR family transcriptional regulator
MSGGGPRDGAVAITPQAELARIRERRERQDDAAREMLLDALLERCGSNGYRAVSVQEVLDSCAGNRVQFYRHFASKQDAYVTAHAEGLDALTGQLLAAAGGAECWRTGLDAALGALARTIEERPARMRALLVEVHVAGEPALAKRAECHARLAGAIDRARRDMDPRHPTPPEITSSLMVGAIDSLVTRALLNGRPQDLAAELPGLAELVASAYGYERKRPGGAGKAPPGQFA